MLLEQEALAEETRAFLKRWGLKGIYVSEVCDIHFKTFSRFLNHKMVLSQPQMVRLKTYMYEYQKRNS